MNVFEDLVVELKQENLLERTVIEMEAEAMSEGETLDSVTAPSDFAATSILDDDTVEMDPETEEETAAETATEVTTSSAATPGDDSSDDDEGFSIERNDAPPPAEVPIAQKPRNGSEFYKKRAVGEISNLQMVEHVLTGVEREYLKIVPRAYDDFNVKKALNTFLHVNDSENSDAHAEAEFAMMQETEGWCSALAERDKNIPVSSFRQFCENSRPALSSQALVALARFYRNLPFSESVRSKFDFSITRLFSRPNDDGGRLLLFSRDETVQHLNMLYREWASVALYDASDDDSNLLLAAMSFDDLANEAAKASSFDELIKSDFFVRLRSFKESVNEIFLAPGVVAAAIECNVRVGNAYVTLIGQERQKMDAESLRSKYSDLDQLGISDAAGRSLSLVEIIARQDHSAVTLPAPKAEDAPVRQSELPPSRRSRPAAEPETAAVAAAASPGSPLVQKIKSELKSMNKWLVIISAILVLGSVGIYVYSTFMVTDDVAASTVQVVEIDPNSPLTQYLETARISSSNFYGVVQPTWDALPKDKRQEVLKAMFQAAKDKGCTQLTLLTKEGKQAGFASATRLDVAMQ